MEVTIFFLFEEEKNQNLISKLDRARLETLSREKPSLALHCFETYLKFPNFEETSEDGFHFILLNFG